jgi:hypothetical protein
MVVSALVTGSAFAAVVAPSQSCRESRNRHQMTREVASSVRRACDVNAHFTVFFIPLLAESDSANLQHN